MSVAPAEMSLKPVRQSWFEHASALGALIALTLLGFHDAVAAALQVWWVSPTYSHCFLIIPISAWLVWERRDRLANLYPAVEPRALWALPPLLALWWMGELSTINEVRQIAVIAIVEVAIVAMLGLRVYRVIWFAALYLFFLVPTGEYLIGPMQRFATVFTDSTLNLIGIPHYTEGTVIELTNGRFEIAEACAGLRFLIATVALGVLFAYLMFRKRLKIALFLLACVLVPLIGNGLRVVGIILLAHFTNNKYGAGADHLIYGWGFNVAILLVLFLIGSFFRDPISEVVHDEARTPHLDTPRRTVLVLAATAFVIGIGPAVAFWHDSRAISPDIASLNAPLRLHEWQSEPLTGLWRPVYTGVDAEREASLIPKRPGSAVPVDLYIGYYGRARTGHSVTAHVNKLWNVRFWTGLSSSSVQSPLGPRRIVMQEWIVSSASQKRIIWASYWVDGTFTTSVLKVKLLQAQAALEGHEGEALVAVSTVIDGTVEGARERLSSAMSDLDGLPLVLDSVNRRASQSSN